MRGWTAVVALALLVPGCMDGRPDRPTEADLEPGPSTSPPGDTYWFVQVVGKETSEDGPGIVCDRGFSYDVNVTERRLLMAPLWHPYDPDLVHSMLAVDVDHLGDCPLAYGLHANHAIPPLDVGVIGMVHLSIDEDTGDVQVSIDEEPVGRVGPGQQLRLNGDGERKGYGMQWHAHGEALIVNHGAWPRSGLLPTADGPRW